MFCSTTIFLCIILYYFLFWDKRESKGKSYRGIGCMGKIAALILLKLFINGCLRWHQWTIVWCLNGLGWSIAKCRCRLTLIWHLIIIIFFLFLCYLSQHFAPKNDIKYKTCPVFYLDAREMSNRNGSNKISHPLPWHLIKCVKWI